MNDFPDLEVGTIGSSQLQELRQNIADIRTPKTLRKGNVILSTEQYREILETVYWAARKNMIARALVGSDLINYGAGGEGIESIGYDVGTEVSAAELDFDFLDDSEDIAGKTRTNAAVPIIQKTFNIKRRALAASQRYGTPLDKSTANSAAFRVASLEDTTIIQGYSRDGSTYEIPGFYQGAGLTESTAKDFGTAGYALAKIGLAMAAFEAVNVRPPFNLVLNPTQYAELAVSVLGSGAGQSEMLLVKNLLSTGDINKAGAGGMILPSTDITAGTGLMMATPGRGQFSYHVPVDVATELEILEKSHNVFGRVFLCSRLILMDTYCSQKLTGI